MWPLEGQERGGPVLVGECGGVGHRPGSLSCTPENGTGWDQKTEFSGHRPMPRSRVVSEVPLHGWFSPQASLENPLQRFPSTGGPHPRPHSRTLCRALQRSINHKGAHESSRSLLKMLLVSMPSKSGKPLSS